MQRSIGLAVAALFMALAVASPALAAEEWWYGGEIADGGHFYADVESIRSVTGMEILGVMVFPPGKEEDIYWFEGVVFCDDKSGFYTQLFYVENGEERSDEFLKMHPQEATAAAGFACSARATWPGLGFKPVADPVEDALGRYKAAQ